MQKQYEENVWETSNDTYSLSVRVQTTINHISMGVNKTWTGSDRIGLTKPGPDRTGLTKPGSDCVRLTKPGPDPKKVGLS